MNTMMLQYGDEFKEYEESYNAYLDAQQQSRSMQAQLRSLSMLLSPAMNDSAEIQRQLKSIQDGMLLGSPNRQLLAADLLTMRWQLGLALQQTQLDKLVRSIPPVARKPPNADILSARIFAIPEVLERILLFLTILDLLRIQQVSHHFFAITQSSPKLRIRMALSPAPEQSHLSFTHSYCLFPTFDYFFAIDAVSHARIYDEELAADEVVIKVEPFSSRKMPKIGKRCREMFICQPPIKLLNVYTRCCRSVYASQNPHGPAEVLRVESGIRLGDLIDAYEQIYASHRLCPDASVVWHDEAGHAEVGPTFRVKFRAQEGDPALLARKEHDRKDDIEKAQRNTHRTRITPYVAAKQIGEYFTIANVTVPLIVATARDNGQPIPTLEQFESELARAASATETSTVEASTA